MPRRRPSLAVQNLEDRLPHNDPNVSDVIALGGAAEMLEEQIQNVVLALHG